MKKSELIALLIKLGIKKENAEKIASATSEESTETVDSETLITEWKQSQIALMKNEPLVVDDIRASELAKQRAIFEQKIKQTFGLSSEDTKEKKNFEEILTLAKEKSSAKVDKTTAELQQQLLELTNENKRLNEEEIPKIKNEVVTHKKKFDIGNKLLKLIPSEQDKLRYPFETASKLVIGDLNELYDVDSDENGELILFEKGKDLRAKTKDGTKFISAQDVINERLEHHKALVKSNADPSKQKHSVTIEGKEIAPKLNIPGVNAAKAHLDKMKADAAAVKQ